MLTNTHAHTDIHKLSKQNVFSKSKQWKINFVNFETKQKQLLIKGQTERNKHDCINYESIKQKYKKNNHDMIMNEYMNISHTRMYHT